MVVNVFVSTDMKKMEDFWNNDVLYHFKDHIWTQAGNQNQGWATSESSGKNLRWDAQNFLRKFERFFVILGLKILRLLMLKVVFKADINKS